MNFYVQADFSQRLCNVAAAITAESESILGLGLLGIELYVLRSRPTQPVDVYDTAAECAFFRSFAVPELRVKLVSDMTACPSRQCVYIADGKRVHKCDAGQQSFSHWDAENDINSLSVTGAFNLLATLHKARKLIEFAPDGQIVRSVKLPAHVEHPWHAIEIPSGKYIICHGEATIDLHLVSLVDADGQAVRCSYGSSKELNLYGELDVPLLPGARRSR